MSSPIRMDASALRVRLYDVLKHVDAPVEITRNGRVVAVLSAPKPSAVHAKPQYDPRRLARICARNKVSKLSLFGSVTRDDFGPDSDVDVLVHLTPGARRTLSSHCALAEALDDLFGRPADLHYADTLAAIGNAHLQAEIASDLKVIYEA